MQSYILILYEFLTVFFPAAALSAVFLFIHKKNSVTAYSMHFLYTVIFSVYLYGVFHYTGAGTVFDFKRYGLHINPEQINVVPFSDPNIDITGYILNIILFMPLGFLLPFACTAFCKFAQILVTGFLFSLLIELSQLLNIRATDIDDLIMNTAGAVLGMLFFRLFCHMIRLAPGQTGYCKKYEAAAYITAAFLCRFFTYNEFGAAKLLFGF